MCDIVSAENLPPDGCLGGCASKQDDQQSNKNSIQFIYFFSNFFPLTFLMLLTLDFLQQKPSNDPSEKIVFSNNLEASEEQQRLIALHVMTNTRSCRKWLRTKNPEKSWKVGEKTWHLGLIYTYIVRTVLFIEICFQVSGPAKTHGPVVIPRSESSHGKSSCESQTLWRKAVHFRTHQPSNLPSKDYFFRNLGYSHTR